MNPLSLLAGLMLAATVLPAVATEPRIHIGPSWSGQSQLGATPAVFMQFPAHTSRTFRDTLQLQHFANLGVVAGRSRDGDRQDVWLAGAGVRATRSGHGARHWFLQSQVFMNANETSSLAGHFQFGNGIGYARGPWEVMVKHISNARIRPPNHGETMLLVGYDF